MASLDRCTELLAEQNQLLAKILRKTELYPSLAAATPIPLEDVAKLVGRSMRTVKRWEEAGTIPIRYLVGGWPVVAVSDLPQLMADHGPESTSRGGRR